MSTACLADNVELTRAVKTILLKRWVLPSPLFQRCSENNKAVFLSYCYDPSLFEQADPFASSALSGVSVEAYVERLFRYMTGSDVHCVLGALRLMDKYHQATGCTIADHNVRLLFFVAFMIMTKATSDDIHRADYYARVSGVHRKILTGLEIILTFECRWELTPTEQDLAYYSSLLDKEMKPFAVKASPLSDDDLMNDSMDGLSDAAFTP